MIEQALSKSQVSASSDLITAFVWISSADELAQEGKMLCSPPLVSVIKDLCIEVRSVLDPFFTQCPVPWDRHLAYFSFTEGGH